MRDGVRPIGGPSTLVLGLPNKIKISKNLTFFFDSDGVGGPLTNCRDSVGGPPNAITVKEILYFFLKNSIHWGSPKRCHATSKMTALGQ